MKFLLSSHKKLKCFHFTTIWLGLFIYHTPLCFSTNGVLRVKCHEDSLVMHGCKTQVHLMEISLFQRASEHLSPQLKGTYSLLQMHSYWAHLESRRGKDLIACGKDLTAARGVWESLLKSRFVCSFISIVEPFGCFFLP